MLALALLLIKHTFRGPREDQSPDGHCVYFLLVDLLSLIIVDQPHLVKQENESRLFSGGQFSGQPNFGRRFGEEQLKLIILNHQQTYLSIKYSITFIFYLEQFTQYHLSPPKRCPHAASA